ncbi:MAG: hypothetical protein LUH54_03330, partial [Firmicutes bacterium]|nr:hypothetical protein [Bacillota bacterium]
LYCYGNSLDTVDVSENDNLTKMNSGGFTALRVCDKIFSDEIFMEYVSESIDSDGDGWLSEEECLSVTEIDVHDMGIESLDGLYCFTSLESLDCSGNQLETLELDEHENLRMLDCSDNNLTWLSVMNNRKLASLYCGNNQLEELDLCYILSSYLLSESYTEDEFSDDDIPKLEILSCEGNNLAWIEYIWENTNLWYINCSDNQLTSLDFWGENLKELYCSNNYLDSLWVTDSLLLEILDCSDNYLCELNIDYNNKLTELYCTGNSFTELDLSSNTELEIYVVDESVTLYLPTSE